MAKLDLSTRAERIGKLVGRDLGSLPKTPRLALKRFTDAIGIDFEKFVGYKPSTQKRYIRAARQGRTAEQERQRVKEVRAAKRERSPAVSTRAAEIESLRLWLDDRIETTRGMRTITDELDVDTLLSAESIELHIDVYGETYVRDQLRAMKKSYIDTGHGGDRWRAFNASSAMPDHPDERWFWYHGRLRIHQGPIDWANIR